MGQSGYTMIDGTNFPKCCLDDDVFGMPDELFVLTCHACDYWLDYLKQHAICLWQQQLISTVRYNCRDVLLMNDALQFSTCFLLPREAQQSTSGFDDEITILNYDLKISRNERDPVPIINQLEAHQSEFLAKLDMLLLMLMPSAAAHDRREDGVHYLHSQLLQ